MNFDRLKQATSEWGNVVLMNIALGSKDTVVSFKRGADELGATSSVSAEEGTGTLDESRSADSLLSAPSGPPSPNAIKIDVEAHEYEVVSGMRRALAEPSLRLVGIEVHFRILQERGESHVPSRLEMLLEQAGFSVTWADSSHQCIRTCQVSIEA